MKKVLSISLITPLLIFSSCGKKEAAEAPPREEMMKSNGESDKFAVGKDNLLDVVYFEKKVEKEGHIKFIKAPKRREGKYTIGGYRIIYTGISEEDREETVDLLRDYVGIIKRLLSDYPEKEYYIENRKELKAKMKLSKRFIRKCR